MRLIFTALRALLFGSAFVSFWAWMAILVHRRYHEQIGVSLPAWLQPVGVLLVLAGGVLAIVCVGTFVVIGQGTPAPFDAPRRFVAKGPYRYVRNPMYVGAFFAILGFGLFMSSPAILLFGLPWIIFAHAFVLVYEEPALRRQFGGEYEDYCRRVNRWMPRRSRL